MVMGIGRLTEESATDLADVALAMARAATDTGRRTSLDEVLAAFGHTLDGEPDGPSMRAAA